MFSSVNRTPFRLTLFALCIIDPSLSRCSLGAYPSSSHHVTSFVHTYIEDYYHRNNNNEDIMVKEGDNNEHENDQGLKNDNDAIAAEFNHKYLYDPSTQRQLFSIQGNFGGRHAHRKNIRGTSDCLRNLQLGVGSNGSSLNNKAFNNPSSIELHLIGHVQGDKNDLDIGSLPKEKVIFHSDLNSIQVRLLLLLIHVFYLLGAAMMMMIMVVVMMMSILTHSLLPALSIYVFLTFHLHLLLSLHLLVIIISTTALWRNSDF
jgi:hypothetical protein